MLVWEWGCELQEMWVQEETSLTGDRMPVAGVEGGGGGLPDLPQLLPSWRRPVPSCASPTPGVWGVQLHNPWLDPGHPTGFLATTPLPPAHMAAANTVTWTSRPLQMRARRA